MSLGVWIITNSGPLLWATQEVILLCASSRLGQQKFYSCWNWRWFSCLLKLLCHGSQHNLHKNKHNNIGTWFSMSIIRICETEPKKTLKIFELICVLVWTQNSNSTRKWCIKTQKFWAFLSRKSLKIEF